MIVPVIHVIDYDQVKTNAETCLEAGVDHIFIIDHDSRNHPTFLSNIYARLKKEHPELWIGINFLFLDNVDSLELCNNLGANACWCDNAHLLKPGEDSKAKLIASHRSSKTLYFGGVEFKYQRQPKGEDLEWVYSNAKKLVDVITTSGPGTGREIEIRKLARIRELVGNHPIAVASGVNERNKKEIEKYADYLMVASSITDPISELISLDMLRRLLAS